MTKGQEKPFEARIVTTTPLRAGQLTNQVRHILLNTFKAVKKHLRITVVACVICPICEKRTALKS